MSRGPGKTAHFLLSTGLDAKNRHCFYFGGFGCFVSCVLSPVAYLLFAYSFLVLVAQPNSMQKFRVWCVRWKPVVWPELWIWGPRPFPLPFLILSQTFFSSFFSSFSFPLLLSAFPIFSLFLSLPLDAVKIQLWGLWSAVSFPSAKIEFGESYFYSAHATFLA